MEEAVKPRHQSNEAYPQAILQPKTTGPPPTRFENPEGHLSSIAPLALGILQAGIRSEPIL
jgi:hypothetical protein